MLCGRYEIEHGRYHQQQCNAQGQRHSQTTQPRGLLAIAVLEVQYPTRRLGTAGELVKRGRWLRLRRAVPGRPLRELGQSIGRGRRRALLLGMQRLELLQECDNPRDLIGELLVGQRLLRAICGVLGAGRWVGGVVVGLTWIS